MTTYVNKLSKNNADTASTSVITPNSLTLITKMGGGEQHLALCNFVRSGSESLASYDGTTLNTIYISLL